MKVVIFLVAFLVAGCSGPLITVRPLPTNDAEFYNLCYDTYTKWPNMPIYLHITEARCAQIVQEYNERRIKEGKVPYENDPNLIFWSYW